MGSKWHLFVRGKRGEGGVEGFGLFLANLVTNVLFHVNHNFGKSGNKYLEMILKNETETNLRHGITKT